MTKDRDPDRPFALSRLYAAVSLAAVLGTAIVLAIFYRELSIRTIVQFGQQSNVAIATTALSAILPEMSRYLQTEESVTANAAVDTLRPEFFRLIDASVRDTPIVRIKVYKKNGIVLYSTKEHEIGTDNSANPRFRESIQGGVRSELNYRDGFNLFDYNQPKDNLIETYVPIRLDGEPRPVGVFEIYTDVNSIVRAMAHNELLIFAGITVVMIILYSFLLYTVHRADKVIASQRQTILERTHTLEVLSARMLVTEETERRRIAWELHEEVAQTLSAIKLKVEADADVSALSRTSSRAVPSDEIVPLIQDAIRDVRALAMDLSPPALEDFGLIAATNWLCREAEQFKGGLRMTVDIAVSEEEVPAPLKGVIFRILQQTLSRCVRTPGINDIRVALRKEGELLLSIEFRADPNRTSNQTAAPALLDEQQIANIWERAVLSGGAFRATRSETNCYGYQATWMI